MKKALSKRIVRNASAWLMVSACLFAIPGCDRLSAERDSKPAARMIAEFCGGKIFESDLSRPEIFEAEYALYQAKLARINEVAEKKFLESAARKRGMSVDEFLKREVRSQVSFTDEEVEKEYQYVVSLKSDPKFRNLPEQEKEKKALTRLGLELNSGKRFEDFVREKARESFLKCREKKVIQRMIQEAGLKVYLPEPEPPVYSIPTDGHPALGPSTAPVTVVVFSDFQCSFCAKAAPDLKKLVEAFPGKVRVVLRNFPLPGHKDAQRAAEAAECAHEQGKFWEYHDLLFANQEKLGLEDLKQYAARLGLDMARFDQGLQSGKYGAKVKNDFNEGVKYRVRGTPAFYVNDQPRRGKTADYFADLSLYVEESLRGGKVDDQTVKKAPAGVLAEVDGVPVTEADLPKGAFYEQENRLYQVKVEQVRKLLETRLVALAAQKRGISVDSLYRQELFVTPMPQEMKAHYEVFQEYAAGNPRLMRLGEQERQAEILKLLKIAPNPSQAFENLVMQKLEGIIRNRKLEQGKPALMTRLMQEADVRIHLKPPQPPVYEIATSGYPSLGSDNAPVTVVVFSDFQCPYSAQAAPTLNQVLARYPGRVRVAFRNFPLSFHAHAQKAHEAAECANEQGKFWPYHDILFANQGALSVDDLKRYAANLGIDVERFNRCLDTGRYAEKVKKDYEEGLRYNVRGTPTFFINGTPQRVQAFEQFAWHITGGKEGSPTPLNRLASAGGRCE